MDLDRIRPGIRAVVTYIPQDCPIKSRLAEFGFSTDTLISCRCLSPGGDLAALELLDTVIAVRVADLRGIRVRRLL